MVWRSPIVVVSVVFVVASAGCVGDAIPPGEAPRSARHARPSERNAEVAFDPATGPRFVDVTVSAGLDLHPGARRELPDCLFDDVSRSGQVGDFCFVGDFLGAAAAADYDGDGWVDVYLTRVDGRDRLLRNRGDGIFEDVAESVGVGNVGASGSAAWLDLDNDGDQDLLVTSVGGTRHLLYVNDGRGRFTEEAVARGVACDGGPVLVGTGIGVGDFDLDGYLDVFVAEWRPDKPFGDSADRNRLLRNLGASAPGHFEDVTVEHGFDLPSLAPVADAKTGVYGFAPAFVDLDADGWPELALTADFGTSRLYWNDGAGHLVDGTVASGVGTERNGMGSTFSDIDDDGDLDWFVSAIWTDGFPDLGHRLYRNDGERRFTDVSDAYGIRRGGWGWGAAFFDVDLDGDEDLAMAAGWPLLGYESDALRLWERAGGGPWVDRAAELAIDEPGTSRAVLPFDYDRDGDLDLLVVHNGRPPQLFRNDLDDADWLVVRARGIVSNRSGIGAVVTVRAAPEEPPRVRHIGVGGHLFGQAPAEARFGLGGGTAPIHEVAVRWPASGQRQTFHDVPRNAVLDVVEP